ncbi:hypothetical protein POM88_047772 [Heracleum sosnowskyi]|uniref:Uncharacterized protein n=1 Tax=Heracleum sosnowskyi TaxID=360622 RepID=A0AAD8GTV8_9APIA|nr:hypothetical protein POM88_047772 [Heracleum sosnowskyi]
MSALKFANCGEFAKDDLSVCFGLDRTIESNPHVTKKCHFCEKTGYVKALPASLIEEDSVAHFMELECNGFVPIDFVLGKGRKAYNAEVLVKSQQDMGELGLAFLKLMKFENQEASYNSQKARAADMKNVATATVKASTVKASRLYWELNAQTVKHLDTLHEYMGLMLGVHTAFSDRSSALLTVQTLLTELSSLHSS